MKFMLKMFLLCFFLCTITTIPEKLLAAATDGVTDETLYFSLIPKNDVDQQIADLRPLIHYLEENLQRSIKIVRPQSYQSVIEGILSRTIDFAILGPASYAKARARDNQVEAFASFTSEKGFLTPEGSFYFSVLFTLKGNGYKSLDDLHGKKIAFTDPASTSGYVIPNLYFPKDSGKPLDEFFSGMIYAGSHDRAIKSVVSHYADAAFVSSARIDEAVQKGQIGPEQIVVLWRSESIHLDPFVFRGGLDAPTKENIKSLMLSAPRALKPMLKKMKLVGVEAVSDADYRAIHEIVAREQAKKNPS